MGYHYYTFSSPFTRTTQVPIIDGEWIPVKYIALILGVEVADLEAKWGPHLVPSIPGSGLFRNLLNVIHHGAALLKSLNWSGEMIAYGLAQFSSPLKTVSAPGKSSPATPEGPKESPKRPRLISLPEEEKSIQTLFTEHLAAVDAKLDRALSLVGEEAVRAFTSLPEFHARVNRITEQRVTANIEQKQSELAEKYAKLEENMMTELAERRKELEIQMEADARASVARNFNPAVATAVVDKRKSHLFGNIDVDQFLDTRK